MAGFCGFVQLQGEPAARETLQKMAQAAAHRGPDGIRIDVAGEGAFAHLALNATAPIRKGQPLTSPDGALCLVADLRLDNRRELIPELARRGLLETGIAGSLEPDDAEVLLAAYRAWKDDCVEHLLGDFAFVLWDRRERRLLCARDPLGVKPLFYAQTGALFCFASEAQQILEHPAVPRRLDELSVALHLAGWPPEAGRSYFEGIHRLPAAHRLAVSPEGMAVTRYWDPGRGSRLQLGSEAEYAAAFRELLHTAVTDRLRSCGETVGVTVSGGMDSTSVAALALRASSSFGTQPRILGCSFMFPTLEQCDERPYSKALSEATGLEVAYVNAERRWLLSDPALYVPFRESPLLGWQSCHEEVLGILRERGARVLLTGHGGDHLLRGSPWVYLDRVCRGDLTAVVDLARTARAQKRKVSGSLYHHLLRPLLPEPLVHALHRGTPLDPAAADLPPWIAPIAHRTRLRDRLEVRRRLGPLGRRAPVEIREVAVESAGYERVVHWFDRNAAGAGIEVRHPYLDRRLLDFVLSVPPSQLYTPGIYKSLLRRAMAGVLPDTVRLRTTKTSFGRFIHFSLAERSAEWIAELFRAPLVEELGWVDGVELRRSYRRYQAGERRRTYFAFWYTISLEIWLRRSLSSFDLAGRQEPWPPLP